MYATLTWRGIAERNYISEGRLSLSALSLEMIYSDPKDHKKRCNVNVLKLSC